jgi:hypothetical protein
MRRLVALVSICAAAAVAVASGSASSVEFEYLLGSTEVTLQQLDCDPQGTSTATLHVLGEAGGPHPGTFEATVTLTAGPQTFGEGELLDVTETFEIVSGDTRIAGAKHLVPTAATFYPFSCSVTPSAECEDVWVAASATGDALRYEATFIGPEGTSREEGYAELRVSADGVRCGGYMQYSSGYFEQFFTAALQPQQPATVTLSPSSATNAVDTFHDVTARVLDDGGAPVAGAIVRFAVTGASAGSGECTSDGNGECSFSYQVAPFPGEDTISAYVDTNANGVQDAGEPTATSTKTIVFPASTPGRTTGGGQFQTASDNVVTFRVSARSDGTTTQGDCTIIDKASGTTIKCLDVLAYVQSGRYATIFGRAEQNGIATLYRISVVDNGEQGGTSADLITVATGAGYVASGDVVTGDIQVK